jgi:hypothetical protein
MVTSSKTNLATYVGIKNKGGNAAGSFSLKITKLRKRSEADLTQFIDGKNVCEEYARDNFRNYSNVLVNVEAVDGSFKVLDGATYLLFQKGKYLDVSRYPTIDCRISMFYSFKMVSKP